MNSKKNIICTVIAGTFISAGAVSAYAEQNDDDEFKEVPYRVSDMDTAKADSYEGKSIEEDYFIPINDAGYEGVILKDDSEGGSETENIPETDSIDAENPPKTDGDETESAPEADDSDAENPPKTDGDETESAPEADDSDAENPPKTDGDETESAPETDGGDTENPPEIDGGDTENPPGTDSDETEDSLGTGNNETENPAEKEKSYDISWYSEADSEFFIENKQQLKGLMMLVNGTASEYEAPIDFKDKSVEIKDHISLEDEIWTPIGQELNPFAGTFNGNGNTISSFKVEVSDDEYAGLFGFVSGSIDNLFVTYATVSGGKAGAIAAGCLAEDGKISNVTVSGNVSEGKHSGGVAGDAYGEITNSVNNTNVSAQEYAGGIAAVLGESGIIKNCYNYKSIIESKPVNIQSHQFAGGIAGVAGGFIENCENNAFVEAGESGGGICAAAENCIITKSLSTGEVLAKAQYAGGIVGTGKSVSIDSCFSTKKPVSEKGIAGGIAAQLVESEITRSFTYFENDESAAEGDETSGGENSDMPEIKDDKDNEGDKSSGGEESSDDYDESGDNSGSEENLPEYYNIVKNPEDNNISFCYYLEEVGENVEDPKNQDAENNDETGITTMSRDSFASGEVSWLLNTSGSTHINEKIWGCDGTRPVYADSLNKPILKINTSFNEKGGSLKAKQQYVTEGSNISLFVANEFRYKLVDLWVSGDETATETTLTGEPYTFIMPAEDVTVHAVFEKTSSSADQNHDRDDNDNDDDSKEDATRFTVIFDANGGVFNAGEEDESTEIEQTVSKGRRVSAPDDPVKDGFLFDGWYLDESGTEKYDFGTEVSSDFTVYASYSEAQEYTVTFDLNGGAGTAPPAQSVKAGDKINDPGDAVWADDTKVFGGWSREKDNADEKWDFSKFKMPKNDVTLYAFWFENDKDFEGLGTQSAPYIISSGDDLSLLAEKVEHGETYAGRIFALEQDSVCTKSIGSADKPFMGFFDGGGYTVTLDIEAETDFQGLFGYVRGGNISNVKVDGTVSGRSYVGGVAGYSDGGHISDCDSAATITASGSYAGGIAGYGSVENSNNSGNVSAVQYVGGIVGMAVSDISNCENMGEITGQDGYAGGIVGDGTSVNVLSCLNSGNITNGGNGSTGDEKAYTGGIAGIIENAESCENSGIISGAARTGGIAGRIVLTTTDCNNEGKVSGSIRVGGIAGSVGVDGEISRCSSTGSITAAGSFAGGISGDCESGAVIENSFCTADVSALSYAGGISARGGTIKSSFYYNSGNLDCPVANDSEIIASYCLSSDPSHDASFSEQEKSRDVFEEGKVSWLMNTNGGGSFGGGGNSKIWSVNDGIPVFAHDDAILVVFASESTDDSAVLADGKEAAFVKENETVQISSRVNSEYELNHIEVCDYWTGENISITEQADFTLTADKDYMVKGIFTDKPEKDPEKEPEQNPDKQEGGDKDNSQDDNNSSGNKNSGGSSFKKKDPAKPENDDNGSSAGSEADDIDHDNNTNSIESGGSQAGTFGSGSGGGGQAGGGADSGVQSGSSGETFSAAQSSGTSNNSMTAADEVLIRTADTVETVNTVRSSNVISNGADEQPIRNEIVVSVSMSADTTAQSEDVIAVAEEVQRTDNNEPYDIEEFDNVPENNAQTAGIKNDVSAGSKKTISRISMIDNDVKPTEPKPDKRVGIMAVFALVAGFLSDSIVERQKKRNKR